MGGKVRGEGDAGSCLYPFQNVAKLAANGLYSVNEYDKG